jgi:mRNA interferase HigB
MRLIGQDKITIFIASYPDAKASLETWVAHVKSATWKNPYDVTQSYRTADPVKNNRVIFNIQHNKYRLIVKINYGIQIVEVRFIGTHKEYDRIDVETI